MRPKNKFFYKLLTQLIGLLQIVADSYYIGFMIPVNLYGSPTMRVFNGALFLLIISGELSYRMRCPLTVWRNRLRKIWHPRFEHEDSAAATVIHKLGFKKPQLWQIQILGTILAILTTFSFLTQPR